MKRIIACALTILLLANCKKHVNPPPSPSNPTIYVAGSENDRAVVWKNGQPTYLALSPGCKVSQALGMTISGSDVYVAGLQVTDSATDLPTYWKNGAPVALPCQYGGVAFSIAVSGSDVYVAGEFDLPNGSNTGAYWMDGQPTTLIDSSSPFRAFAIAVAGSNVYIGGEAEGAVYWANGQFISIPPIGYNRIDIFAIATSGSDVYLVGTYWGQGYYWKNGVAVPVTDSIFGAAEFPTAIAISGSDVYLAGGIYFACYWKNGALVNLSDGTHTAYGTGIAVADTSVYISGTQTTTTNSIAKYWKNGISVNLTDSTHNAEAVAISLVE
jgi:hypothetical protein